MTPEEKARQLIDAQLAASGWIIQTKNHINLSATRGVAVCELSFANGESESQPTGATARMIIGGTN